MNTIAHAMEAPMFRFSLTLAFILIFLTATWAFVYWWKKSNYTRERFAFLGAATIFSLITVFLLSLTNNISLWSTAIYLASLILGPDGMNWLRSSITKDTFDAKLSPVESTIAALLILAYANWFQKMFAKWPGQKSNAQHHQESASAQPNLVSDIALFLNPSPGAREKLKPYLATNDSYRHMLSTTSDNRAWHQSARMMWTSRNRRHYFDDTFDLEYKCWWGQDKSTGIGVSLVCCQSVSEAPSLPLLVAHIEEKLSLQKFEKFSVIIAYRFDDVSQKDSFLNGIELKWVSEADLLDDLVDFSDYFADLDFRLNREKLPDSTLTLSDVYSRSMISTTSDHRSSSEDAEDFLNRWLEEDSARQIALLGEYGQGKSAISLIFSHHLMKRLKNGERVRVPILIELRGKSPRSLTPEEILAMWAYRYRIDVQSLLQLAIAGRLLLIFEGFDEMDLTGDTDARLNHFRTLWKFAYPKAKLLITGRPNFFLDDMERKRALGVTESNEDRPFCAAIFLRPFDELHISDSLRHTDEKTRAEICALARKDKKFLEIVSRPSLLFIVATIWNRENLSLKTELISSALIMDLFIRHSYRRQSAKEAERNFMALNNSERAYFMQGIAGYMAAMDLPNQISAEDLNMAIEMLVEAIPEDVSRAAGAMSDEVRQPLRTSTVRFDWNNNRDDALDHIKTDVRACGILVSDLSKDGHFKFAHKSFMEFLQAQIVHNLYSRDPLANLSATSIVNTFGFDVSVLDHSQETMKFLAELIIDESSPSHATGTQLDNAVSDLLFNVLVVGGWNKSQVRFLARRITIQSYLRVSNLPFFPVDTVGRSFAAHTLVAGIILLMSGMLLVVKAGTMVENQAMTGLSKGQFFSYPTIVAFVIGIAMVMWTEVVKSVCAGVYERATSFLAICDAHDVSPHAVERHLGSRLVKKLRDKFIRQAADDRIS